MPELPEVETTRRGIEPWVKDHLITDVIIRNYSLRVPIDERLPGFLVNRKLKCVDRRAKYLCFVLDRGFLIWHLGMSGSMRIVDADTPAETHDHVDIIFDNDLCLRYRDPRRFGLVVPTNAAPAEHRLLRHLGPEPWAPEFDGQYLYRLSRGRKLATKNFIMDGKIVVGVGNIYANESLYLAGIDPRRAAGRVSATRYEELAVAIRSVLDQAIAKGGTTLKDFVNSDGKPGYFRHELQVYDRAGKPCTVCSTIIKHSVIGQRSSFFCPACQR